ncbi:hypothetical protein [Weissella cibaria]|uniref:hypothetical protein n=1 Tax=Weissella cibaria TaxID=137591 RepID=UPI00106EDF08|nr:hypothetical protein [Weissella cibaria]
MKNEMKKVIPIPDGTERIEVYSYASVDDKGPDYPNGDASFMVDYLPDVPDKRVIELPADVIDKLKMIKEDNGDDNLQGFMNDVNDDDELREDVTAFNYSVMPTDALLGEWWLEHVEFAPKKEPKFEVEVKIGTATKKALLSDANYVAFYSDPEHAPSGYQYLFSDEQADELVAGLTALNARKVKVEE